MEKHAVVPVLDRQMFENNQIQEMSLKDEIVFDKSNQVKQNKKPTKKSKKRCIRGKRRSRKTGRCRKNCAPGYKRSKTNRCVRE
jgi:hypothetical protein